MTAADFFGGRDVIDRTYPAYHPMRELLITDSTSHTTTCRSFQLLYDANQIAWLKNARKCISEIGKPRSMKVDDLSSYSSILGEMRAFADFLTISGFTVSPRGIGTEGPDFMLKNNADGTRIYVEVITCSPRPDNERVIGQTEKEYFDNRDGGMYTIVSRISVQDPFGFPILGKEGESTTANAVSKICSKKFDEHQFDDNSFSILYLDTQSLDMSHTMLEQTSPVLEMNDTFTSGAIWLAYYGETGFPILENAGRGYVSPTTCVTMQHDGHFKQKAGSKLNAVIISVANDPHKKDFKRLALLENAERPLPDFVRTALINSGCFDEQQSRYGSLMELKARLQADKDRLLEAYDKFQSMHI